MNTPRAADFGYLGIRNIDKCVECFEVDYGDAGPIKDSGYVQEATSDTPETASARAPGVPDTAVRTDNDL